MTDVTVKNYRQVVDVFELRKGYEYAYLTVTDKLGSYGLTIESSFCHGAFTWFNVGVDFYDFLANIDSSYLAGKLDLRDYELDVEATLEAVRKEIEALLESECLTEEEADEELDSLDYINDQDEFVYWLNHTTRLEDAWELHVMKPGPRYRGFLNFYKLFWGDFEKALQESNKNRIKVKSRTDTNGIVETTYSLPEGFWGEPRHSEPFEYAKTPKPKGLGEKVKGFFSKFGIGTFI